MSARYAWRPFDPNGSPSSGETSCAWWPRGSPTGSRSSGDAIDRTLQGLMKGYATEHFEIAMYEALDAYATVLGDVATAKLTRRGIVVGRDRADVRIELSNRD